MNAHGRNAQAAQASAFAGNDAAVAVAEHLSAELWGPLTTRDRAHLLKTKQNKTTPNTHQRGLRTGIFKCTVLSWEPQDQARPRQPGLQHSSVLQGPGRADGMLQGVLS